MGALIKKLESSRWIHGKMVFWLFIITNLVYIFMLTVTIPEVMSFAGGMKLMDMLPAGYDFEYVYALLNTLGLEGRRIYLFRQIPADMIYPALFGISYCILFLYFIKKLGKLNSSLIYLSILPLIGGLFDYLENMGIIRMLIMFPDLSENLVSVTNVFTIIKSLTTSVYFIILLITLGVWIMQLLKMKKTSPEHESPPV